MILSVDTDAVVDSLTTLEEIRAEALRLARVVDAAQDQRARLFALAERLKAEASAGLVIADMTVQQKSALATMLAQDPDVIAAAKFTAGLDPALKG